MSESDTIQGFRLSPQQRRIWSQAGEGGEATNWPAHLELQIRGPLETELLMEACDEIVAEYEVLRTDFHCPPGIRLPVQVIREPEAGVCGVEDLRQGEEVRPGAVLEEGVALRGRLLRHDEAHWVLLLQSRALNIDGFGLRHLATALVAAYRRKLGEQAGGSAGDGPTEEVMQYADLAEWQNELLEGEDGEAGRRFWARRSSVEVSGDEASGVLPRDRGPAPGSKFAVAFEPVPLAAEVGERLEEMANSLHSSLDTLILGAWSGLLSRLTGRTSITVAHALDGRSYEGTEGAIGSLERYLPISVKVTPTASAVELWGRLQEALEEAGEEQEFFPYPDDGFLPFACHVDDGPGEWTVGATSLRLVRSHAIGERFVVRLNAARRVGRLVMELAYDFRRLSREAAIHLAEELATWFSNIVAGPRQPLLELQMLGPGEEKTLAAWTARGEHQGGSDPCFVRCFEQQVDHFEEKMAVIVAGETMSYGELDTAANRWAHLLKARGVGPEMVVGLFLERSLEQVALILGLLKAGAAFLPLDPSYPRQHIQRVLEFAEPAGLVTRQSVARELPTAAVGTSPGLIYIEDEDEALAAQPTTRPAGEVSPRSLAYLMFTSGSTGDPKGVMVSRVSVGHYVYALAEALGVTAEDVYLHTASFSFSSSVRHLLLPLARGAMVVVTTAEERTDPQRLFERITHHGVTVMDTVPAFWRTCLETFQEAASGRQSAPLLRLALSTGEALATDIPRGALTGGVAGTFINMFGQTESTGMVAVHPMASETLPEEGGLCPLGRSIPGASLHVLDRCLRPVPIGCAGHLYLAGEAPARGYLRRPALTAQWFVPDPFSGREGARLLATGDLGRFGEGGELRFLGRRDRQVQIRGFRIEPGELESVLIRQPGVARCAISVRDSGREEAELIAYVVAESGEETDEATLRDFMAARLPEYKIPSRFALLDELPTTTTGKVNYRALPELDPVARLDDEPPVGELEESLAEIWAKVLEVPRVGRNDDFFHLGGHSMRGILIMSRVQELYGVEIPAIQLFEVRTVAQLAVLIEEQQISETSAEDLAAALEELGELSDDEVRLELESDQ